MADTDAEAGPPITVVVADPNPLFRSALSAALSRQDGFSVVATAGTADQALHEVVRLRPDVLLVCDMDLRRSGLRLCASTKERSTATRTVVVSEEASQEVLLSALESGVDGYLARTMRFADVVATVRRVHGGETCIPPGMLGGLLRGLIRRRREEDVAVDRFSRLSPREKEVFALLVDGCDHRSIAERLVVSPHTARTHIQNVLEKLEVHSRLEALALAVEHRLLERFAVGERTA